MGELVYEPPSDGPILWEIGIPDRTARGFYIPDPNPKYVNKLFLDHPDRLAFNNQQNCKNLKLFCIMFSFISLRL